MEREERVVTTVRVPRRVWIALRAMAEGADRPGRPTLGDAITDLVEAELARRTEALSDRA
jgi:hypothetical protein